MGWFKRKNNNVEEEERRRRRLNDMATSDPLHASLERPFSYQDQQPEQDDGVVLDLPVSSVGNNIWKPTRARSLIALIGLSVVASSFTLFLNLDRINNYFNPVSYSSKETDVELYRKSDSVPSHQAKAIVEPKIFDSNAKRFARRVIVFPHSSESDVSNYVRIFTYDLSGKPQGYAEAIRDESGTVSIRTAGWGNSYDLNTFQKVLSNNHLDASNFTDGTSFKRLLFDDSNWKNWAKHYSNYLPSE